MKISNLTKIYNSHLILDIKNLNIDTTKIIGLTGTNGSGKSTLLRIISGIEKPTSGTVDLNISTKDISILLPEPMLLKRSIRKNFEFVLKNNGLMSEFKKRVKKSLNYAGLNESFLDKKYYELSSGQTVRVAFALIIAIKNRLILLDEPTNSVDLQTARLFSKAIKELNLKHNCGFIIASHDEKWLSVLTDENIFLYNGKVAKFEYKNVFETKNGKINFGKNLNYKIPFKETRKVAIDPSKITLEKMPSQDFYKGLLHSISLINKNTLLVKIKFGDYLLKCHSSKNLDLKTGDEIYFKIENDAFEII